MAFFTERCPNCTKSIAKNAEFCDSCGCPSATAWITCGSCAASVGSDSKFCWKCGVEQSIEARKQVYQDRWRRSAADFAVRVEISLPEKVLRQGLQVDDGTLGLLFQDGRYVAQMGAGYYTFPSVFQRLVGFDQGKSAHVILLDVRSAELDFIIDGLNVKNFAPVDVRIRLLFRVIDTKLFADRLVRQAPTFSTHDLANAVQGDVRDGLKQILASKDLTELVCEVKEREIVENDLVSYLTPLLSQYGMQLDGVRLADFGGPIVAMMRNKLGDITRLTQELELNRKLRDAVRAEKLDAYRDEEELKDRYDQITREYGFKSTEQEHEQKLFIQAGEQKVKAEALRLDYDLKRAEIMNRLDEQALRHQSEIADVQAEIERKAVRFEEDIRQQHVRFEMGQGQQIDQARTDLEVGKSGLELLERVNAAKAKAKREAQAVDIEAEERRLKMRGEANIQALLATVTGEQGERLLKLAELEMRKGLTAEQSIALVVEKSPEIAPALAVALQAKYSSRSELQHGVVSLLADPGEHSEVNLEPLTGGAFISYASQDLAAASLIKQKMEATGLRVWFDKKGLESGDQYELKIRRQILTCRFFIPLISKTTDARLEGFFRREWYYAVERLKDMHDTVSFIFPIVIDNETRPYEAKVPDKFMGIHWTTAPNGVLPPEFSERLKQLLPK